VYRFPGERATFEACKLDWSERERHAATLARNRDLLRLRRDDVTLARARRRGRFDGAVLGEHAFLLRFFGDDDEDRLLLVNLGTTLELPSAAEPLLGPVERRPWTIRFHSEAFAYDGGGTLPVLDRDDGGWSIPGETAVLLAPERGASAASGARRDREEVTR
jgi:maltooligosyltrehalose trehalohydrolase